MPMIDLFFKLRGQEFTEVLDLSHFKIGWLPPETLTIFVSELAQLQWVHTINFSNNQLGSNAKNLSILLDGLAQLPRLRSLNFSRNGLGQLPQGWFFINGLAQLPQLQSLNLSQNDGNIMLGYPPKVFLPSLAKLKQLRVLDLSHNLDDLNYASVTELMDDLAQLPQLHTLTIGGNFRQVGTNFFQQPLTLVDSRKVVLTFFQQLPKLKHLTTLNFSDNCFYYLARECVAGIEQLPKLQTLGFAWHPVDASLLQPDFLDLLLRIPQLQTINLHSCALEQIENFNKFLLALRGTSAHTLHFISDNGRIISAEAIKYLAVAVKDTNITKTIGYTDPEFHAALKYNRSLKSAVIALGNVAAHTCNRLSVDVLKHIASFLSVAEITGNIAANARDCIIEKPYMPIGMAGKTIEFAYAAYKANKEVAATWELVDVTSVDATIEDAVMVKALLLK